MNSKKKKNKDNSYFQFIDVDKLLDELESEIDKEMPTPDSSEYNRYLAMKAYSFTIRSDEPSEAEEKVISLLEPIKLQPEAIYLYLSSLNIRGEYFIDHDEQDKAIQYLKKAEETHEEFKATGTAEAMTEFQIFGMINKTPDEVNYLLGAFDAIMISLYKFSVKFNNHEMQLKYVMPSIKAKFRYHPIFSHIRAATNFDTLVIRILPEIRFLTTTYHFPQVNHLLAVLMYQLIKYKRSLPEEEKHFVLKIQGLLSYRYACWAYEIIQYSITTLEDKTFSESHPINTEVFCFDELMETGVQNYVNQFPCEPILTHKELKKAVKQGKAWCKRTVDLLGGFASEEHQELMPAFNALEIDIEQFAHLKGV